MGAQNFVTNTGKTNYYNVAYGALSTRVKEITEDLTEVTSEELKALNAKKAEIDLRGKYVVKDGDYPYIIFYQGIEGKIVSLTQKQPQGMSKLLEIKMLDSDGDDSLISVGLYTKYTENLLNRLNSLSNISDKEITLAPYSIPNTFTGRDGNNVTMYNQGFSIKAEGVKLEVKYKNDNPALPKTEIVQDAQGNDTTSRVKRINFLLEEALGKLGNVSQKYLDTGVDVTDLTDDSDLPF